MAILVYFAVQSATGTTGIGGLIAAFSTVVAFYATNTIGVSLMISLTAGRPLGDVMRGSAWSVPINLCLGLTGAFLGSGHSELGVLGTGMFVIPLALLRFTLVIFSRKSRDTIKTLETMNEQLSDEVAQRTVAEEALGESEAHLRAVLDNVAEGILTVDDHGKIETCNPAGEQVFGFPAAEMAGRHLGDLVPMLHNVLSAEANSFARLLTQAKLGSEPQETTGRRRDGRRDAPAGRPLRRQRARHHRAQASPGGTRASGRARRAHRLTQSAPAARPPEPGDPVGAARRDAAVVAGNGPRSVQRSQ